MASVLVLRRGGLGDTLLLAPLLRALRRCWPGARLCLAGVREFAEVLAAFGCADEAWSSEDLATWALGGDAAAGAAARARLCRFAHVYADAGLPAFPGSPATTTFDPRRHVPGVPFGLQLARQVGLEPDWPGDAQLAPARLARPLAPIALAPGSGGRTKCWPRARWLELAALLGPRAPLQVVVGPTELEADDPRRWPWPDGTQFLCGRTALQLAQALAAAGSYVGNDSGTTHLAAMLGVPAVALFGPSDPAVWAPVGAHVRVLEAPGRDLAALPAGAVAAALP
ncbi:MAG: glycosyltransferase family 9 protein [Planctomycetes bacterium]|nr:glycosyltransferase family 9 protein [Planctomycetota bacterium]